MGRNAYFAFQVVGFHGSGSLTYRLALTAVFVEGLIFLFLSIVGMRQWLVKLIPASMKIATGAGIGLYLTLIGLSPSAGIGVISGAVSTPLDLAGCPDQYKNEFGICVSHKLQSPTVRTRENDSKFECHHIANVLTALDWNFLRRDNNRSAHDVQSEKRDDCWNCACLHFVLAASNRFHLFPIYTRGRQSLQLF